MIQIFTNSVRNGSITTPLCSRNFQNVKTRLDFVKIWSFFPPLRFYMKSSFGKFKWSKDVILVNFGLEKVTLGVNYSKKYLHIFKSVRNWIYNNLKLQYADLQQNCIYLVAIYKNSNLLYFNLIYHIWIYPEDNLQYLNLP